MKRSTWRRYLEEVRALIGEEKGEGGGEKLKLFQDLLAKVREEGLLDHPFSPRLLYEWGFDGLLPEGGAELLRAIVSKNLTASWVAKELGLSPTMVGWWVRGKYAPRPRHFRKLSELLGIPVERLRELFPSHEQEVVLDRAYLRDRHLPEEIRIYRRIGLMRHKAEYLIQFPSPSVGDALWYAQYLLMELSLLALRPIADLLRIRLTDISVGKTFISVDRRVWKGTYPFPTRRLRYYQEELLPILKRNLPDWGSGGETYLFPHRQLARTPFKHLKDVMAPFQPHEVRKFILMEAEEVLGSWGVRKLRGKDLRRAKGGSRLSEAWGAYLAYKVKEAEEGLPILWKPGLE